MSQVKSNSNGFKVSAKRAIALISAAALSLFGLVATSTAANAAPVTKPNYASISRDVTNNEFIVLPGEKMSVNINSTLPSPFVSDGAKSLVADHGVTTGIAGITYGSKSFMWDLQGCNPMTVFAQSVVPCLAATYINVTVFQDVTNTSGSAITVTTNLSTAKFTYGSTEITPLYTYLYPNRTFQSYDSSWQGGLEVKSQDSWLNANFDLCLDTTLFSAGDTLSWTTAASIGGTSVATVQNNSDNTVPYMQFNYAGVPVADITVQSPVPSTYYVNVNGGNFGSTTGALVMSVDLKKDSTSVLKACPTGGGGGSSPYFGKFTSPTGTGAAVTLAANQNLVSGISLTEQGYSENFGQDGNGGMYYGARATADPTKSVIMNLKASGGFNSNFGTAGKLTVNGYIDSMGYFGSGVAKTKWATIAYTIPESMNAMPAFRIITGTTAKNAAATTKTLSLPNSLCGNSPWLTQGVDLIAAPTDKPLVQIYCSTSQMGGGTDSIGKSVLGFVNITSAASATVTKIGDFGTAPTVNGQNNYPMPTSIAVNPVATGTQIALVAYVKTTAMSQTPSPQGPTVVKRQMVSLTQRGAMKVTAMAANPWGASNVEPMFITLAPGTNATSPWYGVARYQTFVNGAPPTSSTKLFNVAVTTNKMTVGKTLTGTSVATGSYVPIKSLSSGFVLARERVQSGSATRVGIVKIKISTGAVTLASKTVTTPTFFSNRRNIGSGSLVSVANTGPTRFNLFGVHSSTKYSVASWTLPTS